MEEFASAEIIDASLHNLKPLVKILLSKQHKAQDADKALVKQAMSLQKLLSTLPALKTQGTT